MLVTFIISRSCCLIRFWKMKDTNESINCLHKYFISYINILHTVHTVQLLIHWMNLEYFLYTFFISLSTSRATSNRFQIDKIQYAVLSSTARFIKTSWNNCTQSFNNQSQNSYQRDVSHPSTEYTNKQHKTSLSVLKHLLGKLNNSFILWYSPVF